MLQYNDLQLRYRRGTTTSRGSPASSSLELTRKLGGGGEGVDAAVIKQTELYYISQGVKFPETIIKTI